MLNCKCLVATIKCVYKVRSTDVTNAIITVLSHKIALYFICKMQDVQWNKICSELENRGKTKESDRADTLRKALHIFERSKQQSIPHEPELSDHCRNHKQRRSPGKQQSEKASKARCQASAIRSDMLVCFASSLSKAAAPYQWNNVQHSVTTKEVHVAAKGFKSEADYVTEAARMRKRLISEPRRSLQTTPEMRKPWTLEGDATHLDLSIRLPAPPNNRDCCNNEEDERFLNGLLCLAPNKEKEIRTILGASPPPRQYHRISPGFA